jgi:hypothetical protein
MIITLGRPDLFACGKNLDAGTRAGLDRSTRTVRCIPCLSTQTVRHPLPAPTHGTPARGPPLILNGRPQ